MNSGVSSYSNYREMGARREFTHQELFFATVKPLPAYRKEASEEICNRAVCGAKKKKTLRPGPLYGENDQGKNGGAAQTPEKACEY